MAKANPRRSQALGAAIAGILAGRAIKAVSGGLLQGLAAVLPDEGMGALNFGNLNRIFNEMADNLNTGSIN